MTIGAKKGCRGVGMQKVFQTTGYSLSGCMQGWSSGCKPADSFKIPTAQLTLALQDTHIERLQLLTYVEAMQLKCTVAS